MNVEERDRIALAGAETLRAAGFDVGADYLDCVNPGPLWRAEIDAEDAVSRQVKALNALQGLTPDDVRALLEALG